MVASPDTGKPKPTTAATTHTHRAICRVINRPLSLSSPIPLSWHGREVGMAYIPFSCPESLWNAPPWYLIQAGDTVSHPIQADGPRSRRRPFSATQHHPTPSLIDISWH